MSNRIFGPEMGAEQPDTRLSAAPATNHSPASGGELSPLDFKQSLRAALSYHPILSQVQIVDRPGDLPPAVQRHILANGLAPDRVRGAYADTGLYLVAGNIPDVATGIRAALHEAVGHQGLRAILLDDFEPQMLNLHKTFPRDHNAWETTAQRYGYLDTGTDAGRVAFAEELCAYLAEQDETVSEWDMMQAEIRQAIREHFPELPMTELDVRALVQRSRESLILRHGNPEAIADVQARQARRTKVASNLMDYKQRIGKGLPDPLSLALYRGGSQVVDDDGIPCRLYHGAGSDVGHIDGTFWGSPDPAHANDYAAMRSDLGAAASVVPYYADIRRPFDGDPLQAVPTSWERPNGLTVAVFVDELIRQSGASAEVGERLRAIGSDLMRAGRREESGPSYSTQDFWYGTRSMFGREGEQLLAQAYAIAGFDGVRFTEAGKLTYGAFSASQLSFLDQGASLRGWQPDRHHGEGLASQEAFARWFGVSKVVDKDGNPLMVHNGTDAEFTVFDTRDRALDMSIPNNLGDNIGSFFAENKNHAKDFGKAVSSYYLKLENPKVFKTQRDFRDYIRETSGRTPDIRDSEGFIIEEGRFEHRTRETLEAEGFDGVMITRPNYTKSRSSDRPWFIAFYPNQIKSAQNNRGTYDPGNPDVRFKLQKEAILPLEDNPAFSKWFDDSKIVTPDGAPLRMFHGTNSDITAYEEAKIRASDLDAYCNGYWFNSNARTTPATRDATVVMPVYLAIKNPASYALVEQVARQVRRDGELRPDARSNDDEVRFRLQEMGYDGFLFTEPVRLTAEQRAIYAQTGEITLDTNRGEHLILRHAPQPVRELREVSYQADALSFENRLGQTVTVSLSQPDDAQVLLSIAQEDGVLVLDSGDDIAEALAHIKALRSGAVESVVLGDTTLHRTTQTQTYPEMIETGEILDIVDLYTKENGHITGYSSLDDFEAQHSDLVAVAFQSGQIKSAIGNRGTFDPNNSDIRYAIEQGGSSQLEDNPAFRQWFGHSKVTQQGRPQPVYHGSPVKGITEFTGSSYPVPKPGETYDWTGEQEVIQFISSRTAARTYGKNVTAAFLALENPLVIDAQGKRWGSEISPLSYLPQAVENGHDGIIVRNVIDVGSGNEMADTFMVFRREQIKSALDNVGTFDAKNPDIRFSFAGVGAQTADIHQLDYAKKALKDGLSAEQVRQQTGWFQGDDKKWRFEIDDSQARYLPVLDKTVGKLWTESLDRVIRHPALFAAYPGLRNLDVVSMRGMDRMRGRYVQDEHAIWLNADNSALDQFSTLMHEIQHSLQAVESFARGGSPESIPRLANVVAEQLYSTGQPAKAYEAMKEARMADLALLIKRWRNSPESLTRSTTWYRVKNMVSPGKRSPERAAYMAGKVEEAIDSLTGDLEFWEKAELQTALNTPDDELKRASRNAARRWARHSGSRQTFLAWREIEKNEDPERQYFFYRRLAGEVEARNVQARQHLSAAMRKATPPAETQDIPGEETLVAFPYGPAPAASEMAEAEPPSLAGVAERRLPAYLRGKPSPDQLKLALDDLAAVRKMDPYASMPQRPNTNERQRERGRTGLHQLIDQLSDRVRRRLNDPGSEGIGLLGASIYRDFAEGESFQLLGRPIASNEDLATVAQVYRNPHFETLRVIYTRDDEVVGESAISSRMPSAVRFQNLDLEARIAAAIKATGATGFFLLHNHPSGVSEPSDADMRFTMGIFQKFSEFRGHVVIDHNEYSTIMQKGRSRTLESATIKAPWLEGQDFTTAPSEPHAALGMRINGPAAVVEVAKRLNARTDQPVLISTTSSGDVSLITTIPTAYFDYLYSKLDDESAVRGALSELRQLQRASGSGGFQFLVTPDKAQLSDYDWLWDTGLFTDLLTPQGESFQQTAFFDAPPDPIVEAARATYREQTATHDNVAPDLLAAEKDAAYGSHALTVREPQADAYRNQAMQDTPMPEAISEAKRQAAFGQWFEGSQVVDANGLPMAMYHGTRGDFDEFDVDRFGFVKGWFINDPDIASTFGSFAEGGNVRAVYLAVKNPVDPDVALELAREAEVPLLERAAWIQARWDGYKMEEGDSITCIPFRPEQIKPVFDAGSLDFANPDTRLSFAGESARTADRLTLAYAQKALAAGMAPNLVREQTGWHQGVDGRFRFEINDSKARLLPALDVLSDGGKPPGRISSFEYLTHQDGTYTVTLRPEDARRSRDFTKLEKVGRDVLNAVLPRQVMQAIDAGRGEDESSRHRKAAGLKVREAFDFGGLNALQLKHVLHHPELFAAYPALCDLPVQVDPSLGNRAELITFKKGGKAVRLGVGHQLSGLLHELQHQVQEYEGFAQGGNVQSMRNHIQNEGMAAFEAANQAYQRVGMQIPEVLKAHETLDSIQMLILNELGLDPFSRESRMEIKEHMTPEQSQRLASCREAYWAAVEAVGGFEDERVGEFIDYVMERDEARFSVSVPMDVAKDHYMRLAGEVEARNVETRMELDSEQRRTSPPEQTVDISKDFQIIKDAHGAIAAKEPEPMLPELAILDTEAGTVLNRVRAGEALQGVADELLGVLDASGHDVGWMDGGCRLFAEGLGTWSQGQIQLGVTGRDQASPSHVVGVLALGDRPDAPCVLLDADGVNTPAGMLAKLAQLELSPGEQMLAVGKAAEDLTGELLSDPAMAHRLSHLFNMRLGDFDSWRSQLNDELVTLGYMQEVDAGRDARDVPQRKVAKEMPGMNG
ncbi:LPD23 domain-containing protein [Vreelandella rituensis]|uniref:RadC-like JAB domain-containing protein n=1 Tax=Vreelandella rituensis TaxID=2282306 RepID=A0A368UA59_9GAMM|nr:LPD23 domain-containing protein [Halomonas rituensis]RCV93915.1 hypothetical protein DU506_01780 [Halomonas rituensis]